MINPRLCLTHSAVLVVVFILFGCAAGSSIITGTVRSAISQDEVKIYIEPPSQYETIGIVEAASDVEFSRQAAQDRVIHELKAQAAKIGANGIILVNTGTGRRDSGYYSNNVFYASSATVINGQGKAIYVIEK